MKLPAVHSVEREILSFFADRNFERSRRFSPGAYNPEFLRRFLKALGNPQLRYRTLHIAGTVGKGSTTTYLSRALSALGFRTGAYLSPHFVSLRERITIDGAPIPGEDLGQLWQFMMRKTDLADLSFFDAMTAMAFLYYAERKCHWAVIEVGLGGRLDSTNNLQAQAAIITRIDYDHRAILGNTLAAIAQEKAGIIRPGQNVYTLPQPEEAMNVVREVAGKSGAQLNVLLPRGETFSETNLDFALQIIARETGIGPDIQQSLLHAIDQPVFGRWTLIQQAPQVFFDGAHNVAGISALAALVNRQPEAECNFFLNTMKERNLNEFVELLRQQVKKKVNVWLFPVNDPLYHDTTTAALPAADDQTIAQTLTHEGALHIFTGSMSLYAELKRRFSRTL